MISKKGFTLFEVLIVITIMAIIAVAALTSTINTQKQFVFINTFKSLISKIKEPRLFAVTQKAVDLKNGTTGIPSSYGVEIKKDGNIVAVTVFADLEDSSKSNEYDSEDTSIGQSYTFDALKYSLTVKDDNKTEISYANIQTGNKLTFIYSPSEIRMRIFAKDPADAIHQISEPYIYLTLTSSTNSQLTKNMVVFLKSGIVEEIQDVDQILQ